jgi:tetratricopeptide (TPR) repeat protein
LRRRESTQIWLVLALGRVFPLSACAGLGILPLEMGEDGTSGGASSGEGLDATEFMADPSGATPTIRRAETELPPGERVGRYVVLERVGAGGMGVVYAAYDPELDRRIALKVLKPQASKSEDSLGQTRLIREAQAMARLSHTNVVSVFDVGAHGGNVFVAMEFIMGSTLREWLEEQSRGWKEVLGVMVPAGRGLAAAHTKGLVHRDFKPDNVLLGTDGVPRVVDFGLAAPAGVHPAGPAATDGDVSISTLDDRLTKTGIVMGTPAYMAPEQHRGRPTDARTDQFNFSVTLYQALYGERPFRGKEAEELRKHVLAGDVRPTPPDGRVPAWVRRIVLRGLSVNPTKRFPSMDAMLVALERNPAQRQRKIVFAVSMLGLGGFGLYGVLAEPEKAQLCDGARERLAGVWDDARQARVEAAFSAVGRSFADRAWQQTRMELDEYAAAWVAMHEEACLATHERGDQSAELLDRRMQCLEQRRTELSALTELLTVTDAQVAERAVAAASALTPVEVCADVEGLLAAVPPPSDPRQREQVEALRVELAQVRTSMRAGKYQAATAAAERMYEDSESLGYPPVEAEAALLHGQAVARGGDPKTARRVLLDAVHAGEAAGYPEVTARAWTELVGLGAVLPSLEADAYEWGRHAEAQLERVVVADVLRAELLGNLGQVHNLHGRYDEAAEHMRAALDLGEHALGENDPRLGDWLDGLGSAYVGLAEFDEGIKYYERAVALAEATGGPEHPDTARALNGLAIALDELGRYGESKAHYRRAAEIFEASLGEQHPSVAAALNNLAGVNYAEHDYAEALHNFERAFRIWEQAYGPTHADVALTLGNMGLALEGLGRFDEALANYRRALDLREKAYGPGHPDVALSLENLADLEAYLGDTQSALENHQRALAIRESSLGEDHPYTANSLERLGMVHAQVGQHGRALALFDRVRTIRTAALGPEHPFMGTVLTQIGYSHIELGDYGAAEPPLTDALRILEAGESDAIDLAEVRFFMAQVLWRRGDDKPRALALAQQARDGYRLGGVLMGEDLERAEAWLAARSDRP